MERKIADAVKNGIRRADRDRAFKTATFKAQQDMSQSFAEGVTFPLIKVVLIVTALVYVMEFLGRAVNVWTSAIPLPIRLLVYFGVAFSVLQIGKVKEEYYYSLSEEVVSFVHKPFMFFLVIALANNILGNYAPFAFVQNALVTIGFYALIKYVMQPLSRMVPVKGLYFLFNPRIEWPFKNIFFNIAMWFFRINMYSLYFILTKELIWQMKMFLR